MRPLALVTLALFLAGCGADAPPIARDAPQTGVSLTGDARIGVTGTL